MTAWEEKKSLTDVQEQAMVKFVAQRLGSYGINWYNFDKTEDKHLDRFEYTQEIPLKNTGLGIFKHALKKCTLIVDGYFSESDNKATGVRTRLRYEHFNGGSNGCDLDFTFMLYSDGKIIEKEAI